MAFFTQSDYNYGVEGLIAPQKNDWIVKELEDIVLETAENIKNGESINSPAMKKVYKRVEKSLEKRFGIPYEMVPDSGAMCATTFAYVYTEKGIYSMKDMLESKDNIIGILMSLLYKDKDETLGEDVDFFLSQMRIWDDWFSKELLEIDLQNARINNFPKGIKIKLYWDLYDIVREFHLKKLSPNVFTFIQDIRSLGIDKLSALDIAAPILHEVGHCFGSLSYLYKSRKTRVVFEDVLRDQAKKGKKDPKEILRLAYRSSYGKNGVPIKNSDGYFNIIMNICNSERKSFEYDYAKHSSTDTEFTSDQFATRFGVSKNLVWFLNTLQARRGWFGYWSTLPFIIYNLLISIAIYVSVAGKTAVLGSLLTGFLAGLGGLLIFVLLIAPLYSYFISSTFPELSNYPYDLDRRRIERIRLEVIRELRLYPDLFTEEEKTRLVEDADAIAKVAKTYMSPTGIGGFFAKEYLPLPIYDTLTNFFNNNKNFKDGDKIDRMLEELMENDLYVESNRFTTAYKESK